MAIDDIRPELRDRLRQIYNSHRSDPVITDLPSDVEEELFYHMLGPKKRRAHDFQEVKWDVSCHYAGFFSKDLDVDFMILENEGFQKASIDYLDAYLSAVYMRIIPLDLKQRLTLSEYKNREICMEPTFKGWRLDEDIFGDVVPKTPLGFYDPLLDRVVLRQMVPEKMIEVALHELLHRECSIDSANESDPQKRWIRKHLRDEWQENIAKVLSPALHLIARPCENEATLSEYSSVDEFRATYYAAFRMAFESHAALGYLRSDDHVNSLKEKVIKDFKAMLG